MVQNYTPVMWDDKAFAFVPYEAFSDLPHYPKEKCEQICKELNSLIRLCTYRPKKEDIYFHRKHSINSPFHSKNVILLL